MPSNKLHQGFTLLEVLVASVILISSIAVISIAYRGALIASERADKNIQISGVMTVIVSNIKDDLRTQDTGQTTLLGKGESWGVSFTWDAELVAFKSAPDKLDLEFGTTETFKPRFRLWRIILNLKFQETDKTYQYHELSWLNEQT